MKITIDVSQMCYEGTGVGRYTHDLVEALLLKNSPHEFILWAGALRQQSYFRALAKTLPWSKATWHILPLPPKLAGLAFNALNFPFEWLSEGTDLLHTSDWSEPSSHAPKITTVHDLVFAKYPSTVDSLIRAVEKRRLARLVQNTTHIIADSISTKQDLIDLYHLEPNRITVVYPGISPRYTPQSADEVARVRAKYNLAPNYILSVGTQEPRKNIARLVDAVRDLSLPLVIIGKHGWGDKTQTLGYVPDSDLPALYAGASVFAYPSLYEGFGFPVLEAMACGTPVVTSNLSSLPEVAGDSAILIDPLDIASIKAGIEEALASRDNLVTKGSAQAKKFSWDLAAKQVLEVYEKIAHRH